MTRAFGAASAALSILLLTQFTYARRGDGQTGGGGAQAPARAPDCRKVEPSEVVRGAYLQVLGRPAEPKAASELAAGLAGGRTSVKEVVRQLVLSEEFGSKYVAGRPLEEAVAAVHERLLARPPRGDEAASWVEAARARGLDSVVISIIDGEEYDRLFGESAVPGRPVTLRLCAPAPALERQDYFGEGEQMTTRVSFAQAGRVESVTRVRTSAARGAFCGRVAFWLFDDQGEVFEVVAPPRSKPWCVKAGDPGQAEREETWKAELPPDMLARVKSVAIVHARGASDPGAFTREHVEKAQKTRQNLR